MNDKPENTESDLRVLNARLIAEKHQLQDTLLQVEALVMAHGGPEVIAKVRADLALLQSKEKPAVQVTRGGMSVSIGKIPVSLLSNPNFRAENQNN